MRYRLLRGTLLEKRTVRPSREKVAPNSSAGVETIPSAKSRGSVTASGTV
jgi:hypothetical protein